MSQQRRLIYSMGVSADGFIAGPEGELDWSVPDQELFRFHIQQTRELGVHLCGRHLYEAMVYWETVERGPTVGDPLLEFAGIWRALPKLVFSGTLDQVVGNATLLRTGVADEVAKLKAQPGRDLAVGGAGLAASLIKLDLIDEYRMFVNPVVLGGGTPFLPAIGRRLDLELIETRTFGARVVYLRYLRAAPVEPTIALGA